MFTKKPRFYGKSAFVLTAICLSSGCQSTVDTGASTAATPTALTASAASLLYVSKTGDTLSGALNLPTNGLNVGISQLVTKGGFLGVGTANPGGLVDAEDTSRLDAAGTYNSLLVNQVESPAGVSTATTNALEANASYVSAQTSPGATLSAETLNASTSAAAGALGTLNGSNITATNGAATTVTTQHGVLANSVNSINGTITTSYGLTGISTNVSTGTMTSGIGVAGSVQNSSTGLMTSAIGVQGAATDAGAGNVTNLYGGQFSTANSGGATVTSAYGLNVSQSTSAATTTTNSYGLYVSEANAGTTTNAYGIYINAVAGTNTFGIYDTSNAYEYFKGRVGIGTAAPGYPLHVIGTAGLSTGTAWTNASDARLKDIHGDYEYGLEEIAKLHTVRFNYKKGNAMNLPSDYPMTGFIAQEVQKVIPDAIHKNEKGFLELNADPIHWAAINAIKQLYKKWMGTDQEVVKLKAALEEQKALNAQMLSRLQLLEHQAIAEKASQSHRGLASK